MSKEFIHFPFSSNIYFHSKQLPIRSRVLIKKKKVDAHKTVLRFSPTISFRVLITLSPKERVDYAVEWNSDLLKAPKLEGIILHKAAHM